MITLDPVRVVRDKKCILQSLLRRGTTVKTLYFFPGLQNCHKGVYFKEKSLLLWKKGDRNESG